MIKKNYKIDGMHCTSCAMSIDGELEDTDGVKKANTSYAKSITEVEYDQDKLTHEEILSTIKRAGYSAQPLDE